MKKTYTSLFSALFIAATIYLFFYTVMPHYKPNKTVPLSEFSTKRALQQIEVLSKKPHYAGSENHSVVAAYIINELQKLGLDPKTQEGYTLTEWGNLVKSRNIIARINGSENSKALLLLSHYDSAPHSKSHGASDDASGIATILEGVRAFLHNKSAHKNDIIILFSDAEELGLNGAALFVTQHEWAKEVGFALNFEARGTSGPAYMLMEVNNGNEAVVSGFSKAGVKFPASNSLMYSVYKMLPNDTDLTVFREQGKIQGLNFAFIDDHFNYHTQQDDIQHLDPDTIEHEGSYIMPLLQYYSNSDLSKLDSEADNVYFSTPFGFMNYPFSWNFPLLITSILLFLGLLFVGFGKRILSGREIGKGFLLSFGSLIVSGAITFLGWRIILEIYPDYKEILHGFTYNGHYYLAAFLFLSLSISFLFYKKFTPGNVAMNYAVAPLFLWIVINCLIAFVLPGAGFFILPVMASLIGFAYFIITQKTSTLFFLILSIPALVLLIPFVTMFPVGLGLKILFGSSILLTLIFGLLLPVLGTFPKKGFWSLLLFMVAVGFFINAHLHSGFEAGKAKPNSLVYYLDAETKKANWVTYDLKLDEWTKNYLGENPKNATNLNRNAMFSKYDTPFALMSEAPLKGIAEPTIEFLRDTIIGNQRYFDITITPNRTVNRYDIFADDKMVFHNLKANRVSHILQKDSQYKRKERKILSYYVVDNEPLELQFSINKNLTFDMELIESSFDLLENPQFGVTPRLSWMMPKPFILNDAILIKKKIKPSPKVGIIPQTQQ